MHTTILEVGPKHHTGEGLWGPNAIMVVYVDPLGKLGFWVWGYGLAQGLLKALVPAFFIGAMRKMAWKYDANHKDLKTDYWVAGGAS